SIRPRRRPSGYGRQRRSSTTQPRRLRSRISKRAWLRWKQARRAEGREDEEGLLARLARLESLPENRHSVCLRVGRTDCPRWPIPGRLSQCLLLPVHVWLTAKLGADVQRRALGEVFTRPETCPWVYWKHPTLGRCA